MQIVQAKAPWEEIQKLLASDGAEEDLFGSSVAIHGNLAVVGVPLDDDNELDSGSAYLFDARTGVQLFKLLASDGNFSANFGFSVAINDNITLIGAPFSNGNVAGSGSTYVFDVATGQQIIKLLADDEGSGDQFGFSVAVNTRLAVIGAAGDSDNGLVSGSAYVFDISTGKQLIKLLASDGEQLDQFGSSVAISGNLAVIGAPGDSDNGTNAGSAYIFDLATGQQLFKLLANDGTSGDLFGQSVAIDAGIAVIGAVGDTDNGSESGSAYVFNATTGEQVFKLLAQDGSPYDRFAQSVGIAGNLAIIGASDDRSGIKSGSIYFYDVTTGKQPYFKIFASDGASDDRFGYSIAINGNMIISGALWDDDRGSNSGSAYIFQNMSSNCLDLNISNLIAGQDAMITITQGSPGVRAVTLYGTQAGQTIVKGVSGYCATFGMKGVNKSKVLGGLNQVFDANGEITFNQHIPANTSGVNVFFQSAMRGTCPDECVSNLLEMTVQ